MSSNIYIIQKPTHRHVLNSVSSLALGVRQSSGVGASTSGVSSGPGEAQDTENMSLTHRHALGGHQSSGVGTCTGGGGSDSGPGDSSPHVTDLNGPTEYTIVTRRRKGLIGD